MRVRWLRSFRVQLTIVIAVVALAASLATFLASSATPDRTDPPTDVLERVAVTLERWGADHGWYPEALLDELEAVSGFRVVIALADSSTVIGDSRGELVAYAEPDTDPHAFIDPLRPSRRSNVEPYPLAFDEPSSDSVADPVRLWLSPTTGNRFVITIGATALIALITVIALAAFVLSGAVVRPLDGAVRAATRLAHGRPGAKPAPSTITEFQELNDALLHLDDQLQQAAERRRMVVDELAHEIRTPLTSALGHLRGVTEGYFEADDDLIEGTIGDLELLERLVGDLRLVTRAEQGQLSLSIKPFDLADVVSRAVAAEAGDRLVTIDVPGVEVEADSQRTEQILRNVLSNAVRYSSTDTAIKVHAVRNEADVNVLIRDHGPGIAPDSIERVFERFYRADSARNPNQHATGLGLPIARALARAQGGELTAANHHDGGAVLTLTIPAGSATPTHT